jgi:hypothetical protein
VGSDKTGSGKHGATPYVFSPEERVVVHS